MKKIALALSILVGSVGVAYAAGDVEAGKLKSATCAACHGPDGNSIINQYPNLSGQHESYLVKQLKEFKHGMESGGTQGRMDPVMGGMAMALTDQDQLDLAAYFSAQTPKTMSTPEWAVERGEALYRGGDKERGITACIACHGPRGSGQGLSGFPRISGQHAVYVDAQLKKFRSSDRANDLNGMMRNIAAKLTDEDIKALAAYVGGLH